MTGPQRRAVSRRLLPVALVGALLAGLVSTAAATVEGDPTGKEPTPTTAPTASVPVVEPPAATVPAIESAPETVAPATTTPPLISEAVSSAVTAAVADAGAFGGEGTTADEHAIEITKETEVTEVVEGEDVEFTITVSNTGAVDLADVEVTDEWTPACYRDIGDLASGGDEETYSCTANHVQDDDDGVDDGLFTNTAVVEGETDPDCDDDVGCGSEPVEADDSAAVTVVPRNPDIEIVKTAVDPVVFPGEEADFKIKVTNTGNVELFDIEVTDDLVEDCEADYDSLEPGESVMYNCTDLSVSGAGDGDGDGDVFTNVVEVIGVDFSGCYDELAVPAEYGCCGGESVPAEYECEGEEVSDEDDAEVKLARPGIDITKRALVSPVPTGGTAGFAITVRNTGNVKLTGISVADPLAANCRRTGVTLTPGQTAAYTCTATGVTDAADGVVDGRFTNGASASTTFRGRSFSDAATASVALTVPAPEPPPPIEIVPIVITDPPPEDPDPDPDPPDPDDPGDTDPTVTLAVGDDSVLVSGSTVLLTGVAPGCALTVFVDGVAVAASDSSTDPGTFRFEVPTGALAFGRHDAQVRCDDGSTIFEQPFTLIQPINNSSGLTAILAFVVLILFLLAWRFVVSGRDAPGPT